MPPTPRLLRRLAAVLLAAALTPAMPAPAQTDMGTTTAANELANAYNAAMVAFNHGDWPAAIAGLEKVVAMVTEPKEQAKIGAIHYTLGAAYFNAGDYPHAIEKLRAFLQKYPADPRVPEARLSIARSAFLGKDYAGAVALFAELEKVPALREQALLVEAECYREMGKPEGQIGALEKLIAPEITTAAQANGAVTLAELYLRKNEPARVLNLVNVLFAHVALVDNVVALNSLTVQLGDELATKKEHAPALAAYRAVRSREQVIAFQKDRLAAMEKRMQTNLDATRGNAAAYMTAVGTNRTIKTAQDQAAALLAEFEKLPDYLPGILFRMAKVWYEWDKKWEAIVEFDRYLKQYPKEKDAEAALYSMIVCYADLARVGRTQQLCERYLKEFPEGANANTVGYLLGAVSLQANDPKKAASFFGTMLEKQPGSEFREQMRLGLGNAHFMQGEFQEARKSYRQYLADFPKGQFAEEAQYRDALTSVFLGEYEAALPLLAAYDKAYPHGVFSADAGYRTLVCQYAGSLYEEVIAGAKKWQGAHKGDTMSGEVYSLLGDALAATDKTEEAAEAYTRAYKAAQTDEVLNYAIFEASKMLQKLGKWPDVARMFEEFVKSKPDHPTVVAAMFWIGKAKAREGKVEEAKTFLVEQLKRYLNEPKREAVEQLLQQLAQLCSKRPRPAVPPPMPPPVVAAAPDPKAIPAPPAPAPATPPPLPPYDAVAELEKQLTPLEGVADATGKARLLYTRAELAKLRKQDAEVQKIYGTIAADFKVEQLSPVLLALIGDYDLTRGELDKATACYGSLREDYPKSDYLDFAYVGLGEIAFQAKQYDKALELFSKAADELAASKIKEATMGKARTLLALGRHAEAKKLFEQVAGIREWRGESTAEAVYYLGVNEAEQGHLPEAIAHFQRVFVAYQKFLPWAAKAYLRSAEAFDKMGKRSDAAAHLREMLRNEKLKSFPESKEAEKRLQAWGGAA